MALWRRPGVALAWILAVDHSCPFQLAYASRADLCPTSRMVIRITSLKSVQAATVGRFIQHAVYGVGMQHATESRSKGYFRSSPSSAFDQYLQDIQKLPLITDAAEERRLARLAQKGDEAAAERLVTANLRFVISLREEVPGPRPRPLRARRHRQRGTAQGGPEVRSRPGREVHLLRRVVGAPGGPQGARRADPLGPHPAQPELAAHPPLARRDGAGAGAEARPDRQRDRSPPRRDPGTGPRLQGDELHGALARRTGGSFRSRGLHARRALRRRRRHRDRGTHRLQAHARVHRPRLRDATSRRASARS